MKIVVLCPWKAQPVSLLHQAAQEYLGRLKLLGDAEVRFMPRPPASPAEETTFLLAELKKSVQQRLAVLFLDESGKTPTSVELAKSWQELVNRGHAGICLCLGGAYGLAAELGDGVATVSLLSLSRFTLPHELALVVALEQSYRALGILRNAPYHHGAPSPLSLRGR